MAEPERYTDPQAPHRGEHHMRTPTGELTHEQKLRRQQTHINIFTLMLLALLALLVYAAIFDLDSWPEWVVLGGIASVAVGFMIAVHSR